jgi:hypothetical protein
MGALILLTILLTTGWMGVDASKRDWSGNRLANATWQWVVGGLGLWIVAFPAYLICRNRAPLRTAAVGGAVAYPSAPAPDGRLAPSAAGAGAVTASGSVPPPSASVPPPASRRCPSCDRSAGSAAATCRSCGASL